MNQKKTTPSSVALAKRLQSLKVMSGKRWNKIAEEVGVSPALMSAWATGATSIEGMHKTRKGERVLRWRDYRRPTKIEVAALMAALGVRVGAAK